jgi:hypothetical protein
MRRDDFCFLQIMALWGVTPYSLHTKKWRQYFPLKCRYPPTRLRVVNKIRFRKLTAVKT